MTPDFYEIVFDNTEEQLAEINSRLIALYNNEFRVIKYCKILESQLGKANQKLSFLYRILSSINQADAEMKNSIKTVENLFIKQDNKIDELEELFNDLKLN